ncbi:ribonuclease T2 [Venturia nashicola]|uniref:Ribonuclease T2-like n=1 Tax=Venturia nashicola TaxID=86259 RepID=A0A4Z1NZ17_9PEZI|nr:ribonuclease T2 [Venturia nashicola]
MSYLPSIRGLVQAVLVGSSQTPLASTPLALGSPKTCPNNGLSCATTSVFDTCCINAPGGQFAQTQFWNSDASAGPPGYLGPNNTWTIHGLWPDHCDGRFDSVCDCSRSGDCSSSNRKCNRDTCNRAYSSITNIFKQFGQDDLLSYLNDHWKGIAGDEHLWQHEWSKHGTCVSTLEPTCYDDYEEAQEVVDYFQTTVDLYKSLPSFDWLAQANITPSAEKTYELRDIEAALKTPRGVSAVVGCQRGELREIWYHFMVRGSVKTGEFVAHDPDFSGTGGPGKSCPSSGIKYLPKGTSYERPSPTTTAHRQPTETAKPVGKGKFIVRLKSGTITGCLISNGKWYNTLPGSSCATFTSHGEDDKPGELLTLKSRKGSCGIVKEAFTCGAGVPSTVFQIVDGKLVAPSGQTDWYAAELPRGTDQQSIYTSKHNVAFMLEWRK